MAIDFTQEAQGDGNDATFWVTVSEGANRAGVSTSMVRHWYRSGRLPTQRADGENAGFLVPIDTVMALAQRADATGEALGDALIDLNASYWSEETDVARNELAGVRGDLALVRAEVEFVRAKLVEATSEVRRLRQALDEAESVNAALQGRTGKLEDDLESARLSLAGPVDPGILETVAVATALLDASEQGTLDVRGDDVIPAPSAKKKRVRR
jgi:hypothetical protein